MSELASVGAIAAVILLTVGVGARGIRIAHTPADFMVAAREVSPSVNAAAISGEYLSAASFIGIAGLIFAQGLGSLWYSVGYAAGYLVLLLLVAAPLRRFGAYTIPDFAGGRLHSAKLRQTSTVLVLIIGWFYLLPQMDGAGLTLQLILGVPYWAGVVLLGVVVSGNIAMGGMKGITFVQAFQYWLKICAIGIPTIVLIIFVGHGSTSNLAPDHKPTFTHATDVSIPEALQFTVSRATRVTVTGELDGKRYSHLQTTLEPGTFSVSAGSRLAFGAGAPVPDRIGLVPRRAPMWNSPFVAVGTDAAHPLAATYGLIVATFFGAIGLPHILVRFYTNRDGVAARRTTLIVLMLLSAFYIFPAILGVLGRLRAPQLYLTGSTDGIVLALPTLLLPGALGNRACGARCRRCLRCLSVNIVRPPRQCCGCPLPRRSERQRSLIPVVRARRGRCRRSRFPAGGEFLCQHARWLGIRDRGIIVLPVARPRHLVAGPHLARRGGRDPYRRRRLLHRHRGDDGRIRTDRLGRGTSRIPRDLDSPHGLCRHDLRVTRHWQRPAG